MKPTKAEIQSVTISCSYDEDKDVILRTAINYTDGTKFKEITSLPLLVWRDLMSRDKSTHSEGIEWVKRNTEIGR